MEDKKFSLTETIARIQANPEYSTNEKMMFISMSALYMLGAERYEILMRQMNERGLIPGAGE